MLDREGTPKDVWFDLYYTPAVDERGVLATVSETTARAHGERQRARQEERLAQVNASLGADAATCGRLSAQPEGRAAANAG